MTDQTSRNAAGAFGLERQSVTCADVFAKETELIFNSHWICLGHLSELSKESNCLTRTIEGSQLLAIRNSSGEINVFRNFCRHRGSELVTESNCNSIGDKIRCPYHAWTYDRDGKLVSAPNMADVVGFEKDSFGLLTVDSEVWHGLIWVRMNNKGGSTAKKTLEPLEQHAKSWSLEDLEVGAEINYGVNANWKLIFQNYSECYHCPSVHPALNRLTPYKGTTNDLESGAILGGPMQLANDCETMSMDGSPVSRPLPNLNEDQRKVIAYYTLFPTIFLSFHPDYILIHRLNRVTVSETTVSCLWLFHPESMNESSFQPDGAVEFWDMTNRQDWKVCELAQRGMNDVGFVPGPYSNLESVVAAFDRHYQSLMSQ